MPRSRTYTQPVKSGLGAPNSHDPLTEYADANPEVRAVYGDIMRTRQVKQVIIPGSA
jgi:hypothetical protein